MEKFDTKFHKWYVGGTGEVVDNTRPSTTVELFSMTYDEVLREYRRYISDPVAELPESIMQQLRLSGKIPA